jgi:predicted amidohydrolase
VVDPFGKVIARAPKNEDFILYAECDFDLISKSPARRFFIRDRRPDFYRKLVLDE